jgi:hypothetical protein
MMINEHVFIRRLFLGALFVTVPLPVQLDLGSREAAVPSQFDLADSFGMTERGAGRSQNVIERPFIRVGLNRSSTKFLEI